MKLAIMGSIFKWESILAGDFCFYGVASKCTLCVFVFGQRAAQVNRKKCLLECPLAFYYHDCNDPKSTFQKISVLVHQFKIQNYTLTELPYTRFSLQLRNELKTLIEQMLKELRSLDEKY